MNIYLDINGVILTDYNRPADYANEFIEFVVTNWPDNTYWLTSHCWRGQNRTRQVLEPYLFKKTMKLTEYIQPAIWDELKTDGISFKEPFLWFDDNLFGEEAEILKHYNALKCHRLINLNKQPLQLLDEIVYLRSLV